jgi:hypothetical protein
MRLGTQTCTRARRPISLSSVACRRLTFVQTPGCWPLPQCTLGRSRNPILIGRTHAFLSHRSAMARARHRSPQPSIFSQASPLFFRTGDAFRRRKYCPTKIFIILWGKFFNKDYLTDNFVAGSNQRSAYDLTDRSMLDNV